MGALRHAINQAWDIHEPPAAAARARRSTWRSSSARRSCSLFSLVAERDPARRVGCDDGSGGELLALGCSTRVGDLLPFLFTAVVVLFLYRVLPMPAADDP